MHELVADLYPICRSITGDGVRETLRRIGAAHPATCARGPQRDAGVRLDRPEGVEHSRRVGRGSRRRAGHRLPGVEPPRRRLQRSGPDANVPGGAEGAPAHDAGATRSGSRIAPRTTGETGASACPPTRSATLEDGEYEVCIDTTLGDGHLTYGECFLPGEHDGRGADLVPTSAIPRSPTTISRAWRWRPFSRRRSPALPRELLLSLPLRPGHDRRDHLARAQNRGARRRGSSTASS